MRLTRRLFIFLTALVDLAPAVQAQPLPTTIRGSTGKAFQFFFDVFGNAGVILFTLFLLGWSLFYMMYRLGLEKSGQVPPAYQHKLAAILSFISITPLLWFYARNPNAEQVVQAFMSGWPGFMITLAGTVMVGAFTYYCLSGWWMGWWSGRTPPTP